MTSRKLIAGVLAAACIGLGGYSLFGLHDGAFAADDPVATTTVVTVQVGALKRMTLHQYVSGYGEITTAPATSRHAAAAAAVSASVTGVVARVAVAAGQRVRRGQLLVVLNSDSMTERYATQELARQERLYVEHNTSLKALQDAEARLALLRVTAPLSGTVVSVNVKPGTAVGASTVLAEVMDLSRLVVQTDIPEPQASQLERGQMLQLLGAHPASTRLEYISPTVDPADGAVMAWAPLPPDGGLRPGQYVRIRIVTATHTGSLVAPSESVISDSAGHGVLAVVRGNEAIRVPVRSGLSEDGWVEVSGQGLKAGTEVVTVGAYGLPARTAIRIVSAP